MDDKEWVANKHKNIIKFSEKVIPISTDFFGMAALAF